MGDLELMETLPNNATIEFTSVDNDHNVSVDNNITTNYHFNNNNGDNSTMTSIFLNPGLRGTYPNSHFSISTSNNNTLDVENAYPKIGSVT